MPLVRFEVRNEYGLGHPELYRGANKEDPKALLDGVAVAGLVGILRQLGDLAEFAAEVFHGLQEQVMTTAYRSHKLMVRVQNIEAALPPLEKTVLAQTSHIHFAYTAGSEWHPHVQNEQNHFIYNDLPRFIMDSYEVCRDPPRLHVLDKFDAGGQGSCLKRYSDPTFFRKVSGNIEEPDVEKVPKDRKTRKSKKKRSSQRHGHLLRSSSMSNHSSRMHVTPPIVNGRISPSHTASSIDMTLESDLGDHSNSLGSKTVSGYIECVFHQNSSVQPEEQESKEFSSNFMQYNDITNSVFRDGERTVAYDDFPQSSSPEKIAPSSSCVTWDKKEELVEPKGQHRDGDEIPEMIAAPEMVATGSGTDAQGSRIANLSNPDHLDVVFDDANTQSSSSRIRDQHDEVESETDNYMDALNTIESEAENDIDCQTKHEVEQFSSTVSNGVEDEMHELRANTSDQCLFENESPCPANISSNKGMTRELPSPSSVPSESFVHEYTCSNPDYSVSIEGFTSANALDGAQVESASDPSSSGSGISNPWESSSDKIISSGCKSQESQANVSGVPSVTFWTNGGLLGLEPSKPPVFAVSNTTSNDYLSMSKGEVLGFSNHTFMPSNDGERRNPGRLEKDAGSMERVPSSKCSTSCHEDQDSKIARLSDAYHSNRFSHAYEAGLNSTHAVTPANELPRAADVNGSRENDENSSQMFGFGHRLFVNGFHRKMLFVPDGKPEPASSPKTAVLEQRSEHNNIAHQGQATPNKASYGQFAHKTFVDSFTSSPPLGHMKISFHPVDGLDTSKLKLKFPDGSHGNEGIKDMFASFQLIPEPAAPLHDVGSDSDDDTFCRSSPYISDDCLSPHSESDSEQWESGESSESKDHELYNALGRISPVESVSSSLQRETSNDGALIDSGLGSAYIENGAGPSLSTSFLDLPSFDAVNTVVNGETNNNLDQRNLLELQFAKESTPLPPPLPPVKWRVSNTHSDVADDNQDALSEVHKYGFDGELLGSTASQRLMPAPANKQERNKEAIVLNQLNKQLDKQKTNGQKVHQPAHGKGMDEKEDFLRQIRTKSFTLRRTATAKSTFTTGPTANDKVTAILEKANAIRQAVGSDDGEDDDNWSDT